MKVIGAWSFYEVYNNRNYLFINKNASIGDDLLDPFNKLYEFSKKNNISIMTLDMIDDFENMDGCIFFDFPNLNNEYVKQVFQLKIPKYLVILESVLVKPDNWNLSNHDLFDKVFTWDNDIVDGKKYFELKLAQSIHKNINKELAIKEKFCILIAGNKVNTHPLELYSKRLESIIWFEENYPADFDLYGIGWNEYICSNKYINYLVKKLNLTKFFLKPHISYLGPIKSKKDILKKYKFSICYENARDITGYITEKIFDCFFAGCIPIYWGVKNIEKLIPENCFIDKRKFNTYEELYQFMISLSDADYLVYLDNIEIFLNSDEAYKYSSENFANTLIKHLN